MLAQVLIITIGSLSCFAVVLAISIMSPDTSSKLVFGKDDALFGAIEQAQGSKPFGNFLDAGTGLHSLRWIATLPQKGMTELVAVTADETMRKNVEREANTLGLRMDNGDAQNKVVMGNWFAEKYPLELDDESFDTILADYLIGAMDGFSPYRQDEILPKLCALLKPGGRLYIVGLEPIPDKVDDPAGNIVCRVRQLRDACILLAGHRCYREYPVDWIHRQIQQIPSLQLVDTNIFPILYLHDTIVRQINVGRSKFPYFESPDLAESMRCVLDRLEQKSLEATQKSPTGAIQLGFDYVVAVEKVAVPEMERS